MMAAPSVYASRRGKVAALLRQRDCAAAVFLDDEAHRDPALRWLCGQPGDGVLVISADGESALAAWDSILASKYADAERIVPYTDYGRNLKGFLSRILVELGIGEGACVELPPSTTWLEWEDLSATLPGWELRCVRQDGAAALVEALRAVKDASEIEIYRRASAITDQVIEGICAGVRDGSLATETDAALLIERRLRELGAEGTGFETLAAGPTRSWGIHAFPAWGSGPFGTPYGPDGGLSILDFGIKLEGYTTDVTLSVAHGSLGLVQNEMVSLVEAAYEAAEAACVCGRSVRDAAKACDDVFAAAGWKMPHSLGHGIGLEAHEAPVLRDREDNDWVFAPGMVFTLEPGLYHPEAGGVRLENDYLMTEKGPERLTNCRILKL